MHARVTAFEGSPDRLDEGIRMIQERVVPAARQMIGFKGGYWLVLRQTGKGLAVTLWESEEAMRSTEAGAEEFRSQVQNMGVTIQSVERYEVFAEA